MQELARVVESKSRQDLVPSSPANERRDFEALVRRFGPRCYGVAKRLLEHDPLIAEVLQAAFCSAFEPGCEALSLVQLERRIHGRLIEACAIRLRLDVARDQNEIVALLPRFDATGHRVSQISPAVKQANADQLRRAVRALPPTHRAVYLLREAEGLGFESIADLLAMSPAQVRTCLSLARQAVLTLVSA